MNEYTICAVCCYQGDADLVRRALPVHLAHGCPVIIMSPEDSPVEIPGILCHAIGKRAYIGELSWIRQREHLKKLLTYPHKYFLLNDADSFCVSAKIPEKLYSHSEYALWSNLVPEPRPHASPYPKLAAQPPYFCTRESLQKIVDAYPKVPTHPITPYIDFAMLAWACEAGLKHRAFSELEHSAFNEGLPTPALGSDPWAQLQYRIRYMNTMFCHPIKTQEQLGLCVDARKFYEQQL